MSIEDIRKFMRLDRISGIESVEDLYLIGREVNVDTLELVEVDGKCECGAEGGCCWVSTGVEDCGDREHIDFCPNCGKINDVMSEISFDSEDAGMGLIESGLDEYEDI